MKRFVFAALLCLFALPAHPAGILLAEQGLFGFVAVTHTYSSGSGNETVPVGASHLTVTVISGSSAGGANGGGAGGGAQGISTVTVARADWGGTVAYVVGAKGTGVMDDAGNDGGTSSATGTLASGSIAMSAGCGIGHAPGCGGAPFGGSGGTQSGSTGGNVSNLDGTAGNDGFPSGDGAGGAGGGAAGAGGSGSPNPGEDGIAGSVTFRWT